MDIGLGDNRKNDRISGTTTRFLDESILLDFVEKSVYTSYTLLNTYEIYRNELKRIKITLKYSG